MTAPKTDPVVVGIETHLGARYLFPDMDRTALSAVLPHASSTPPSAVTSLCLVNISEATLVVPFRIIKRMTTDGEEWWRAPISPA